MLSTPWSSARRHASRSCWMVHCCGWIVTPILNGRPVDISVRLSTLHGWGARPVAGRSGHSGPKLLEAISRAAPDAAGRAAPGRSASARRRPGGSLEAREPFRGSRARRDLARRKDAELVRRRAGAAGFAGARDQQAPVLGRCLRPPRRAPAGDRKIVAALLARPNARARQHDGRFLGRGRLGPWVHEMAGRGSPPDRDREPPEAGGGRLADARALGYGRRTAIAADPARDLRRIAA